MAGKVILITLWGQRKESYKGQYAPELIAAIDEYGNEDNPAYLSVEEDKAQRSKEFTHIQYITIELNETAFQKQLYGEPLKGEIKKG